MRIEVAMMNLAAENHGPPSPAAGWERAHETAADLIRQQAALLDQAQDALCVTDLEQRIVYWNQSAERIYGWTKEEALGRDAAALLFAKSPVQSLDIVTSLGEWRGELSQFTKSGQDIVVNSRWTLLRDESGNPKAILIANSDLTEKLKLEAQLLRAQRMECIGALAGGIAHDLNNILAPIRMAADILGNHLGEEEQRQFINMVKMSTQRGAELVEQILSFVRGRDQEITVFELGPLICELVRLLKETFPVSIRIEESVPPELWPVKGSRSQLNQVFANLCVNARDAMPDGGLLRIEAANVAPPEGENGGAPRAVLPRQVVVTVIDTGTGIPPELLGKIFEPLFTTKGAGKGTGLGLATVASIVHGHQGAVQVHSQLGKGSRFSVYLPAGLEAARAPSQNDAATSPMGQGELILVVDDEAAILEIMKTVLENCNYRVLTARDGAEGLRVYEEHRDEIRAIVTDLMMPVLDGTKFARTLRQAGRSVKIIAVSGGGLRTTEAEVEALGLDAFLIKPFTSQKLLTILRESLDGALTRTATTH